MLLDLLLGLLSRASFSLAFKVFCGGVRCFGSFVLNSLFVCDDTPFLRQFPGRCNFSRSVFSDFPRDRASASWSNVWLLSTLKCQYQSSIFFAPIIWCETHLEAIFSITIFRSLSTIKPYSSLPSCSHCRGPLITAQTRPSPSGSEPRSCMKING